MIAAGAITTGIILMLSLILAATELSEPEITPNINNNLTKVEKPLIIPKILKQIALCESKGRHYDENGEVLKGQINPNDTGKYQISSTYWKDKGNELGYDIYSEKGNEMMAVWIYENYGTDPWNSSKNCWYEKKNS